MAYHIDKSKLKGNLKRIVGSTIYGRGADYYRGRAVESMAVSEGDKETSLKISGRVSGSDDYEAELIFDLAENNFYDLECSCPYGAECKHSVALGLTFIDFYEKFLEKHEGIKDFGIGYAREILIDFIGKGKLPDNNITKRNVRAVKKPKKDFSNKNIIEGEFEVKNNEEYKSQKELIDELSAALSTGDSPQAVIDRLIKSLIELKKKNNFIQKNNLLPVLAGSDFNPPMPLPPKNPKLKICQPEKYKAVVEYNFSLQVKIYKTNDRFSPLSPSRILKSGFEFTEGQRSLFEFLKKIEHYSWEERQGIDAGEIFSLLKKSGLAIFRDKGYQHEKMRFGESLEKIKAEIFMEKSGNMNFDNSSNPCFIFKLDERYEEESYDAKNKLLFGSNQIVYILGRNIYLYPMPALLIKILKRIRLRREYYDRDNNYYTGKNRLLATELDEEEIVNLNQIIRDAKEFLDLKTNNVESEYDIKKFDLAEPFVLVDYNSQEGLLEVRAAIDYGYCRLDVSESIFFSRRGRVEGFWRRDDYDGQKYLIKIDGKNIFYALLAKEKEGELFASFYGNESGFTKTLKCKRSGEEQIFDFFENHWPKIQKIAGEKNYKIRFVRDEFNFGRENFKADFEIDLDADNDWLWFDVNCYCGQDQISLEDLKKYSQDKKKFIRTVGGKILKITNFEELERFIMMLESFYAREKGGFEGRLYHAPELENIFTHSEYYSGKTAESFKQFVKEAQSGKPVKKVKLPTRLTKTLRDYQKDGINWFYFLRKYRFAGILADDMGLGKTLQALTLVDMEKVKNKPSIVICPKTLLYNWQSEAKKFTPDLKTIVIDGFPKERRKMIRRAKDYDLVITGYAMMQKDGEYYEKKKIKFNYCILDEAQFIKNHNTKNARIVKKINADYRLALTGTPLENSVSEIWSIFDFLMPGFLGSYNHFVKKFHNPIMKQNSDLALGDLRKKVSCFMLRRVKSEVLKELPPKMEQISFCHLEKEQNILYQEILSNVKSEIFETVKEKGFSKSRIHILAGLVKLRQVCNHPVLLLKDKNYAKYKSAKLEMFMELIDEIIGNKRKVLVFSQFTQMLDILAKELERNKIEHLYLSGQTRNRQKVVREFSENKNKKVFLISLKAGGTGLNLTAADNVIIFDPWWNPSVENQAIDRTHRIGQKNSVNVYKLITQGTIEEKIVKLQEKKKFLFDNLIGESKDLFTKLTWKDIKSLFE